MFLLVRSIPVEAWKRSPTAIFDYAMRDYYILENALSAVWNEMSDLGLRIHHIHPSGSDQDSE